METADQGRSDEKQALRRMVLARREALDPRYQYDAALAAAKKARRRLPFQPAL